MKIKQLELENFRGFAGKHVVKFHAEKPTVIVGVNGSGKTSVLDALFQLIHLQILKMIPVSGENKSYIESDITIGKEKATLAINYFYSKERKLEEGKLGTRYSRIDGKLSPINTIDNLNNQIKDTLFNKGTHALPVFLYFPASRNTESEEFGELNEFKLGVDRRLKIFQSICQDTIDTTRIFEWYIEKQNIQNNERIKRKNFNYKTPFGKSIESGLRSFLYIFSTNTLKLKLATTSEGYQSIVINKNGIDLQLEQLSAGEKMIFGLVLEIMYRISIGNPDMENPLQTDGIVLIDELELHLHPKWQATVLNALHQTFPNIQFIVTTHSPLVINHVQSDQLVLINNDKIVQGEDIQEVYGKDVNSITENIMGAPKRPKDVEAMIKEIRSYLTDDNLQIEKAKEKLSQLQDKIGKNDGDVIELDTMILLEEDETY